MRVPEACRYLGIGRSTLYVLIGDGENEFIKVSTSIWALTESLRRLVEQRLGNASPSSPSAAK